MRSLEQTADSSQGGDREEEAGSSKLGRIRRVLR